MRMNFLLIFWTLLLFSCSDENPNLPTAEGETIFTNGKIYTVNSAQPWAEAIWVKDGVIEAVGTTQGIKENASEGAEEVDLEGALMLPGFHDVHMHPLEASTNNFHFVVDGEENDVENYTTDVEKAIRDNPNEEWILGWGHDFHTVLEAQRSPVEILDEVAPDVAVVIMEQTSHSLWVNSKALEKAGYNNDSPNPTGGILMRDDNDELNGILVDNAGNVLLDLALAPSAERAEKDYRGLIDFGLPELAKHGITSVSDARTYWKRNHHEVWKRIADEGKLTARVNLGLWAYPTESDDTQIESIKSLFSNDENSLLRINQIKVYSDGIIHNTTAAMHDHYKIDLFGEMTNNGLNYFTESRLKKYIEELGPTGFDFHIHALGNRGIHEALNAIEQGGGLNGRHRLTHLEFVDPADYPRFKQLNVIADCQVAGDFTQPQYWSDNDEFISSDLTQNIVPLKDFIANDALLTLSSDWDVSDLNPFVGLQNSVTRAPQNITLEQAIEAYTINSAYVMRQENKVGSIEVGKEADLIVLSQNLFEIDATQISNTEVDLTYLRGALVFER